MNHSPIVWALAQGFTAYSLGALLVLAATAFTEDRFPQQMGVRWTGWGLLAALAGLQLAQIRREVLSQMRAQSPAVHGRGDALHAGRSTGQCLGQQLGQQQYFNSAGTQQCGEGVVLLLRPGHPGQPVEEQRVVVAGGEPLQLGAGPVQDDRTQRADFGVNAKTGLGHSLTVAPEVPPTRRTRTDPRVFAARRRRWLCSSQALYRSVNG